MDELAEAASYVRKLGTQSKTPAAIPGRVGFLSSATSTHCLIDYFREKGVNNLVYDMIALDSSGAQLAGSVRCALPWDSLANFEEIMRRAAAVEREKIEAARQQPWRREANMVAIYNCKALELSAKVLLKLFRALKERKVSGERCAGASTTKMR